MCKGGNTLENLSSSNFISKKWQILKIYTTIINKNRNLNISSFPL